MRKLFVLIGFMFCVFSEMKGQTFQWAKQMGSTGEDKGESVAIDKEGNVYTTGFFYGTVDMDPGPGITNLTSNGSDDIFVMKLDNNGNLIWAMNFGGNAFDEGRCITVDSLGDIVIAGEFQNTVDFDPGPAVYNLSGGGFVLKLDKNGNFVWAKTIQSILGFGFYDIALDHSNNIYLTGGFASGTDFDPGPGVCAFNVTGPPGYFDIFVLKLNEFGNFVWARNFESVGINSDDRGHSIIIDISNNVVITGSFSGSTDFDPGPGVFLLLAPTLSFFVSRLDSNGIFLQAININGTGYTNGEGVSIDQGGNIILTGLFYGIADFDAGPGLYYLGQAAQWGMFILKLDTFFNVIWGRYIGNARGKSIIANKNSDVFVTAKSLSNTDVDPGLLVYNIPVGYFVLKLDSLGMFKYALCFGDGNGTPDVQLDSVGSLYFTGGFTGNPDFDPGPLNFNLTSNGNGDIVISKLNVCGENYYNTVSMCDSIIFNGIAYYNDWDSVYLYNTIGGCDSNISVNLIVNHSTNTIINQFACDSFTFNAQTFTNSGIYVQQYASVSGCDSILTLNLTINNSTNSAINQTACDTYILNGLAYSSSGVYTQIFTNAAGCDSILTLNLTINNSTTSTINQTACDTYTLNGQTYTSSGVYIQNFTNATGCDSMLTLNLTINNSTTSTINQTACDSYTLNGQTYTTSGVYTQNFTNAAGCDSILILNLTINNSTTSTMNQTACDSYTLNGQTYTSSGIYTQNFTNAAGCDSILTLNLTINNSTSFTINQTACDTYLLNGQTFTSSGVYTQNLTNATGCDSILTLNLTINNATTSSLTQTACVSYTLNGQTYTTSGVYTQNLTNASGCDSTLTLNLTIINANTIVLQTGPTLHADANIATYQWLSCNPYQILPGEISQNFTATQNGDYAVIVTEFGCTDTSACYTVSGLGFIDQSLGDISIYPNPNSGTFTLDIGSSKNASIRIFNVLGDVVYESEIKQSISVISLSAAKGVYYYKVKNEKGLLGSGKLLIE